VLRNRPHCRWVLLLTLVATATLAQDRDRLAVRTLLLSEHPDDAAQRIYVKGRVVTVLRFEQPCDPGKTKLLGWEGRFEPLSCAGRYVVLEPVRDLDSDEGVPLLVTLKDGAEIPFLLRPPQREEWAWADQQINVFKDRESYESMVSALNDALKENAALREKVDRFRKEETSEDHALAALLASGAVKQTPFKLADHFSGEDVDAEIDGTIFKGKGKVAVVFKLRNRSAKESWSMKSARLVTLSSGRQRALAMRSTVPSISPGASGVLAFVVDASAFVDDGMSTSLFLEVYRHDGFRQVMVQLDPHLVGE
jgi:uncharacterized protein (TIGR02268 family)